MSYTIIAIDDEPLALLLVETYLKKLEGWNLLGLFSNCDKALQFVESNKVDVILSDINMPDMTGLELVASIKPNSSSIIFITAHKQYAVESYNLDVIDYLVKPVSFERFEQALNKAINWVMIRDGLDASKQPIKDEYLFVYFEYQLIKIKVEDITFVQSMGDYLKINIDSDTKAVLTLGRLKNITTKLADKGFIRIHRSYLINSKKIIKFQKLKIQVGVEWLPVSKTYQKDLENMFKE